MVMLWEGPGEHDPTNYDDFNRRPCDGSPECDCDQCREDRGAPQDRSFHEEPQMPLGQHAFEVEDAHEGCDCYKCTGDPADWGGPDHLPENDDDDE